MEKIDLAFQRVGLTANASRLIQHCKEAGDEISASPDEGSIPQFVPADGSTSWHLLNSVAKQLLPDRTPVFCEWGSGTGLVTMLASLLGMNATGIEIEEDLIDLSRQLSKELAIPATFINASIYPKDNPKPVLNYQDVDLFFAYPWPNQIVKMTSLFEQSARSGAIFVCYHGEGNYRVFRC